MSLINAYEVRYYSPAGPNYDTNLFNRSIETRERYVANKCLGWTFYQKLVNDLISYAGVDWSNVATYSTGDDVNNNSNGLVYTALQSVPSGTALSDTNYWALADKFNTAAYNNLWIGGLRDYLSISIYRASLTTSTFRAESKGVMRGSDLTATREEFSYLVSAAKDMETEAYSNLVDYLKRNAVSLVWSDCEDGDNCEAMRTKNLGFIFYDKD